MDTPLAEVKKTLIPLQLHREETGIGEKTATKGLPLDTRKPPGPTPTVHIPHSEKREGQRDGKKPERKFSKGLSTQFRPSFLFFFLIYLKSDN